MPETISVFAEREDAYAKSSSALTANHNEVLVEE